MFSACLYAIEGAYKGQDEIKRVTTYRDGLLELSPAYSLKPERAANVRESCQLNCNYGLH